MEIIDMIDWEKTSTSWSSKSLKKNVNGVVYIKKNMIEWILLIWLIDKMSRNWSELVKWFYTLPFTYQTNRPVLWKTTWKHQKAPGYASIRNLEG